MPVKPLYRPVNVELTHGKGIWSGPFFPSEPIRSQLIRAYERIVAEFLLNDIRRLCRSVHGFEVSNIGEKTSDGYTNYFSVWVSIHSGHGVGVLFPYCDAKGHPEREITFFAQRAGQVDIDDVASLFESVFRTALAA